MIGVYCIECSNGAIYYGSSIDVSARWYAHKNYLRKNKHSNIKLQNLWNKYGESEFSFYMVEVTTKINIREKENHWLDLLFQTEDKNNIINFSRKAESIMYGRTHSEETRKRLSELTKIQMSNIENREYLSKLNKGKTHTEETRRKMSITRTGKKMSPEFCAEKSRYMTGRKLSDETRAKISAASKLQKRPFVSEETRKKISDAIRAHYANKKAKNN